MNPRDMMAMQMAGGGAGPAGPGGPPPGAGAPPMEPDGDEMGGGQFPPELIQAIAIEVVNLLQGAAGGGAPEGPGAPMPPGGMA